MGDTAAQVTITKALDTLEQANHLRELADARRDAQMSRLISLFESQTKVFQEIAVRLIEPHTGSIVAPFAAPTPGVSPSVPGYAPFQGLSAVPPVQNPNPPVEFSPDSGGVFNFTPGGVE